MGRYSTVQAYSDNNPNMRAVSHSEATASSTNTTLKTEKVYNPYGSTAGAGSGEFHIYRHARAREKERLKILDEEEIEKQKQKEFDDKIHNWKQQEEDKLNKKRKKRMRNKASKQRKKNMSLSGVIVKDNDGNDCEDNNIVDDNEFEYTPLYMIDGEKKMNDDSKGTDNYDEKEKGNEEVSKNTLTEDDDSNITKKDPETSKT